MLLLSLFMGEELRLRKFKSPSPGPPAGIQTRAADSQDPALNHCTTLSSRRMLGEVPERKGLRRHLGGRGGEVEGRAGWKGERKTGEGGLPF